VAGVHKTLWPEETHSELIDGGILIGIAEVLDANEDEIEVESGPGCEMKSLPDSCRVRLVKGPVFYLSNT
jgi:hypothetical protein